MEKTTMELTERTEIGVGVQVPVPEEATKVVPLNCQKALASLPEAEQKEVLALADKIDVRQIEKVMNYGAVALKQTFDQCGKFLKDESGSQADQEVIKQVIELSKKASESYDDFNLVLKEPNFFEKLFLKIRNHGNTSRTEIIQHSAVTSYKLLAELKSSYDTWLKMLKDAMADIQDAALSDVEANALLEKYIIAGEIAKDRIENELIEIENKHNETGLQQYATSYQELKEGYDIFLITLSNLAKSRVMYYLSVGQLGLIKRSNRNIQISIHTQMSNSMALIGEQLRNAVLNEKNRQVLEGQKAINRLSDELIKDISQKVGTTAQQTEALIYAGFYNLEAAKEAVTAVINSCNEIKKTATDLMPKMQADMAQLNELIKELEPCVSALETQQQTTLKIENSTTSSTEGEKLNF